MSEIQEKDIFEPEIPVVPETWVVLPFNKAAKTSPDRGKKVKQRDYLTEGKIPVIDQGQGFIGGYTDDETMAYDGVLPVVLFGDHTRSIKYVDKPFAVGADGIKILKPASDYEPKFFYYLLRSLQIPSRGYSRHFQFLKKFHLPLAPREQQKRIVAEIEKQFSRLDEAVANLKRVKANLKRYKAAVLKAAVEGKLTEEWRKAHPDVEPASKLLDRILAERRAKWEEAELAKMEAKGKPPKNDKWKAKYKNPTAPDTTDLPDLPDGWAWVFLRDLGEDPVNTVQTGPFGAQLHRTEFTTTGVPVIAVGNLTGTGFTKRGLYYVDEAKAKQLARYDIQGGDLLFARSGATLGKVCVAPEYVRDWRMTGHILRARLHAKFVAPDIVVYALAALPSVRKQVFGSVRGVTRPGFNTSLLESIALPIPSLGEQVRIVAEVEARLSLIRETETQVDINLKRAERLRQSILAKAFTGGFVQNHGLKQSAASAIHH